MAEKVQPSALEPIKEVQEAQAVEIEERVSAPNVMCKACTEPREPWRHTQPDAAGSAERSYVTGDVVAGRSC